MMRSWNKASANSYMPGNQTTPNWNQTPPPIPADALNKKMSEETIEDDVSEGQIYSTGGGAGQAQRYYNAKPAGKLDEKCWDGYKQVGGKEKNGKMVPNCVPKESAIMKGLRK